MTTIDDNGPHHVAGNELVVALKKCGMFVAILPCAAWLVAQWLIYLVAAVWITMVLAACGIATMPGVLAIKLLNGESLKSILDTTISLKFDEKKSQET